MNMRITSLGPPPANHDHTCVRCRTRLKGRQRKYCSDGCRLMVFYDRNWEGLRFLTWARNRGRCVKCGVMLSIKGIYEDITWEPVAPEEGRKIPDFIKEWLETHGIQTEEIRGHIYSRSFYYGPLLPMAEIDHIIAITNGGDPMNLDNLQTLCHECHAKKTRLDLYYHKPGQMLLDQFNQWFSEEK